MIKKIFITTLFGIILLNFFIIGSVFADGGGYKISVGLPGVPKGTEIKDPSQYIEILFKTGLGVAGVLGLVFLLYAAVLYSISASTGNLQKQSEAKERIFSVFLGLGLLLLSYLILYTINPDLVKLKIPEMKVESGGGNNGGNNGGNGAEKPRYSVCAWACKSNGCGNYERVGYVLADQWCQNNQCTNANAKEMCKTCAQNHSCKDRCKKPNSQECQNCIGNHCLNPIIQVVCCGQPISNP
ncbi:hypothetical protein J7J41_02330 [bacterium]|nr:hypothetical protein [bacterium]